MKWNLKKKEISSIVTCSLATWQKLEIFSFAESLIGFSDLQNMKSGDKPNPRSSLTLDCVGFVLASPVELG